jgi:site-specific DNA recombinase
MLQLTVLAAFAAYFSDMLVKLKRWRILKQHRGYIDDGEFEGEMAAVELALKALEVPEVNGVRLEDVIEAGERLPGMAALWSVATVGERRDMVTHILEVGGLHYDVEMKEIAAITPRPDFLPVLRLLQGVVEYEEATDTLVTSRWRRRNRRASDYRQAYRRDRQTERAGSSFSRITLLMLFAP